MTQHVSWGSIELLHNVVRTLGYLKEATAAPLPTVEYKAKVKLHGTNCAVQILPEGFVCQSRTGLLTPEEDLKGFAKWTYAQASYFQSRQANIIVFGEWAGPGIEKGMAVASLSTKVFAVFAVQVGFGSEAVVCYDPEQIAKFLPGPLPEGMHILPWNGESFTLNYANPCSVEAAASLVNARVDAVEKEDPWVKDTFGVSGLGEGLVFYPVSVDVGAGPTYLQALPPERLATLMWKAKGEKHRTAGAKVAAQVAPTVVADIESFVTLMVTPARLEQGLSILGGVKDPKFTGKFLQWVAGDVQKESQAELEVSGLTWAQVEKAVQTKAREWFKATEG